MPRTTRTTRNPHDPTTPAGRAWNDGRRKLAAALAAMAPGDAGAALALVSLIYAPDGASRAALDWRRTLPGGDASPAAGRRFYLSGPGAVAVRSAGLDDRTGRPAALADYRALFAPGAADPAAAGWSRADLDAATAAATARCAAIARGLSATTRHAASRATVTIGPAGVLPTAHVTAERTGAVRARGQGFSVATYDHGATLTVPLDGGPVPVVCEGLLTLASGPAGPDGAHPAWWAEQGRGYALRVVAGYVAPDGAGGWYHAPTARQAAQGAARRARRAAAPATPAAAPTAATVRVSAAAGNCAAGTRAWAERWLGPDVVRAGRVDRATLGAAIERAEREAGPQPRARAVLARLAQP